MRIFGVGPSALALLALAAPFGACLTIIGLTLGRRASAWTSTFFALLALVFGSGLLWIQLNRPIHAEHEWNLVNYVVPSGTTAFNFQLKVGVLVDPLAALMVVTVAAVSLLTQWYAMTALRSDLGAVRFFTAVSLLTFATLGVAISTNYFELYLFWELMGLATYFLIGHWWQRAEAAAAAKKAFLVTRLGDLGLLLGICYIYYRFGTLNFQQLAPQYAAGKVSVFGLMLMSLLVFSGAAAKAAQLPFHVWLPAAAEAPAPAAALIHSATMGAAGVYLVARTYALFQSSKTALLIVAFLGVVSALLAGVWALGQDDVRRILAYSTISHLGLMMLAMGIGAYSAALFYLFTHAWFKALLFLGTGTLMYRLESHNMREMGGLLRRMPVTAVAVLVGALAAAGLPPVGAFWGAPAIAGQTFAARNNALTALLLAAVLLGAVYPFRLFFVVFSGTMARRRAFEPRRVREAPGGYTSPMVILAVLTVATAVLSIPGTRRQFGDYFFYAARPAHAPLNRTTLTTFLALGLAGLALAAVLWGRPRLAARWRGIPGVGAFIRGQFYLDAAYRYAVEYALLPVGRAANWIDVRVVDFLGRVVAATLLAAGGATERVDAYRRQQHAFFFVGGLLAVALVTWMVAGRPHLPIAGFGP